LKSSVNQKTQYLVTLAKEGDQTAWEQLCKVYSERVRRIVRLRMDRHIRSKLDSMDVVQDALIHALENIREFTYKNEGDFLLWLSKIAQNALRNDLDKLHADKRDICKEVRFENYGSTTGGGFVGIAGPVDTTTPSFIVAKSEELDRLERAMDQLKPEYRQVILLAKIEGLSYRQIGQKLGRSPDAVGMLLCRAMVALTNAFETL